MTIADRRKNSLINLAYYSVLVVAYYLFVKYAFWLVFPFFLAFVIAAALQKPIRFLNTKTKISKGFWATLFVLLILLILLTVMTISGYRLILEFKAFIDFLKTKLKNTPDIIEILKEKFTILAMKLPKGISKSAVEGVNNIAQKALLVFSDNEKNIQGAALPSSSKVWSFFTGFDYSVLATPLGGLLSTAKQIPAVLTAALVSIISCIFLSSDYDGLVRMVKRNLPTHTELLLSKAKNASVSTLSKYIKSYAMILLATFCEILIGLNILKIFGIYEGGYIFIISVCVAFLDILPVFGTGTVFVPWFVISFITHKTSLGIGLLIIYLFITVFRQFLEPKLVSVNVGMKPIITIAAMYIGLQIFGVIGILILPITIVILKTLNNENVIHLWGKNQNTDNETEEK